MTRILVWDLPTRLFHWLLVATVAIALGFALVASEHSPAFQVHMLAGLVASFLVAARLVWGVVGTRYARFSSFLYGPGALVRYLIGTLRGDDERTPGHNPGAAWGIYALLLLVAAMTTTGVLQGRSEAFEEVHEVLAWTLVATIGAHLVGVVWHALRHREDLVRAMVDGRKRGDAADAIPLARPLVGLLFLALTGGFAYLVVSGHDAARHQVTLFGQTILLGEAEGGDEGGGSKGDDEDGEEEDDDD